MTLTRTLARKIAGTPAKAAGQAAAGAGPALSRRAVPAIAATATAAAMMIACGGAAMAAAPSPAHPGSAAKPAQLNCAAAPTGCGYPGAATTGVQAGQKLTAVPAQKTSGPGWAYNAEYQEVDVTSPGAVLSDLSITGNLNIKAADVTVDNVAVTNSGNGWGIGLMHSANATIEHSSVSSPAGADRLQVAVKDIYGDATGTSIQTTNIWNTDTAIQLSAGTVANNYIHNLEADPGDHVNGIVSDAGVAAGLTVTHNTVFNPIGQTDCIALFEDFGPQMDATVTNNLLSGGGYEVYGGANTGGATPAHITITGNRFAATYYPAGGSYGPAAAVSTTGTNTWSGNTWDATGATVSP